MIRSIAASVAGAVACWTYGGMVLAQSPSFPRGAVATVHRLATEAGVRALDDGGNAVDAAVVAGLVLGVVDGHNSGLGGGCLLLVRAPGGAITAIDGRETRTSTIHMEFKRFKKERNQDARH